MRTFAKRGKIALRMWSCELPTEFSPPYLVHTISDLLYYIATENRFCQIKGEVPEEANVLFTCDWKYEWMEVSDYLDRLKEWIVCGTESFIIAIFILERLERDGALPLLTLKTVHRIFFVALMIAVKGFEDETLDNADFSKVGCVQLKELNQMEVYYLKALNFTSFCSVEEFIRCKRELIHLDVLLSYHKAGKHSDLIMLGRMDDPDASLSVFNIVRDLQKLPKHDTFATYVRQLKEDRRRAKKKGKQEQQMLSPPQLKGTLPPLRKAITPRATVAAYIGVKAVYFPKLVDISSPHRSILFPSNP